jgi:hypothetical protein
MLAGRQLAHKIGRQFWFAWLPNHDCGAGFSDLFEMADHHVSNRMPELEASAYFDGYAWSRMPWEFTERRIAACVADHITLHSFADDQPHDFWNHGIEFSRAVRVGSAEYTGVTWGTSDFRGRFKDLIGVHVRRVEIPNKPVPHVTEYFDAIDKLTADRPDFRIFLATDDLGIRPVFVHRYKDRVNYFENLCGVTRHTKQGMIDAVVELAVLSQCESLVLSGVSGFSMMAIRNGESTVKTQGVRVVENNRP